MSTRLDTPPAPQARTASRPPAPWRVAVAVASVEGPRMLRHPATLLTAALSTAMAVASLWPDPPVLHRDVVGLTRIVLPMAGGVLVAAQLAASRLRRDEVSPLATIAPSTAAGRTCGVLLGLLWPAAAAALWSVTAVVVLAAAGGVGSPAIGDVLAPSGTVLLAGALGTAVGRWLPWAASGLVTLPLVAFGLVVGTEVGVRRLVSQRLMPTSDWSPVSSGEWIEMWPRDPGVHLTYVILVAGALAGIALLRDRRHVVVTGLVVTCAVGAGVVAAQLLAVWDDPDRVETLLRDVQDPYARHRCTTQDGIEVCLPAGYEPWIAPIRDQVRAAQATLPTGTSPRPLRVELRGKVPATLLASLPSDVVTDLPSDLRELAARPFVFDGPTPPEPGVVGLSHLRAGGAAGAAQQLDLALGVIGQATGVPLPERVAAQHDDLVVGEASDEACEPPLAAEVLTFALAAASDPASRDALARELTARPYGWAQLGDVVVFDDVFQLPAGATTVSATTGATIRYGVAGAWSRGAATLGLAVADEVTLVDLHDRWDRWIDPETPADDLLDAVGIDPLPSPATLAAQAGIDVPDAPCR